MKEWSSCVAVVDQYVCMKLKIKALVNIASNLVESLEGMEVVQEVKLVGTKVAERQQKLNEIYLKVGIEAMLTRMNERILENSVL